MVPDPGGPKTYGSSTLPQTHFVQVFADLFNVPTRGFFPVAIYCSSIYVGNSNALTDRKKVGTLNLL
jgi:hypothetical protein